MAYDEKLAARLRRAIAGRKGFVEKKMFGGLGFLLNGNMCLGVWKGTLIVRIDPEEYILALGEPGVRPFDITGPAHARLADGPARSAEGKASGGMDGRGDRLCEAASGEVATGHLPASRLKDQSMSRSLIITVSSSSSAAWPAI